MGCAIGLDIGGTKIAGGAFDAAGQELAQVIVPTPSSYQGLLEACRAIVQELESKTDGVAGIGACSPYADAGKNANIPILIGQDLKKDLQDLFSRPVPLGNDANCAALAEAVQGAGRGHASMFGLIIGTGVGGGFILNGRIFAGANGMCGEIGHLPLPFYGPGDGERVFCGCGQSGCIEKMIAGPALARLYRAVTGRDADARQIADLARAGNGGALQALDRYYGLVAKAMVAILHSFDPDIITVSGGLNALPGLYDEVPKRWGRYALAKTPATKLVPAAFGALAGMRGAALLGQQKSPNA